MLLGTELMRLDIEGLGHGMLSSFGRDAEPDSNVQPGAGLKSKNYKA